MCKQIFLFLMEKQLTEHLILLSYSTCKAIKDLHAILGGEKTEDEDFN